MKAEGIRTGFLKYHAVKKKMKVIVRLSFFAIAFFHVNHFSAQRNADAEKFANTIIAEELKKHLTILASDEYEGRETGQPGQKKAAEYIANYYESLGIEPCVEGSWFQVYPLKIEKKGTSSAYVNNRKFEFIKDFYSFGSNWTELDASQIVFVGYGIEDKRYNDYKKVKVEGKVVMCLAGEPTDEEGKSKLTGKYTPSDWSMDWSLKTELAHKKGATGIIMVNMVYDMYISRIKYWLESPSMRLDYPERRGEEALTPIPEIFISPTMANEILRASNITIEELQKTINKKVKTKTVKPERKISVHFHMERVVEKLEAENVLCYIEGTDPALKDELIVISAHYDHIGITNGEINNGADDDGSGTVATLEIAQAFLDAKKAGKGTRRSILILNVSGEEKGLLGSEWYSEYPVFPLENTVCNLNIDMIGRKDKEHEDDKYVYIIGSDKLSTELHSISEQTNSTYTNLELDYTYNDPKDPNRFYYRSDHYNFARKNIPVIFYFSGVHEDYHKPGDDVEKILFDKMETITKLIFYTAWEVANKDERLKVDVVNDFEEK